MPIQTSLITKALGAIVILPKLIDNANYVYDYFFGNEKNPPKKVYTKKRKIIDSTKLTQTDYDTVIFLHKIWQEKNFKLPAKEKESQIVLTKIINRKLGLNKSRNVYAKIYNGNISRDAFKPAKDEEIQWLN